MSGLVTWVVATAYRRRALTILAVIAASGLFAVAAMRVRFDPDVLALLPRTGRTIPAFRRYVTAFGGVDQLYVIFSAPGGHTIDEYEGDIDQWTTALEKAPQIAQVDTGVAVASRNFGWLADRQLLLLRDGALDKAIARLSADGLSQAVVAQRELLALNSPQMADFVRQDPAGLADIVSEALGPTARALSSRLSRGYISEDGSRRLLIARPKRPPYDTEFSRALDARLQAIRTSVHHDMSRDDPDEPAAPPLDVAFAGGHRIAVETEAVVWRESIWNTVGSLALILPLLFIVFRSLWLVLVGPIPSVLSLIVVGGVLGITGTTLSAASAGSAAMLFGLGVDGVVLLYATHRLASQAGSTEDERMHAVVSPSRSMLLGMWTTAATFYGLVFVDVPSLQQLGLLIGHSMMACGFLTLIMVPALLPRKPSRGRSTLVMPGLARWIAEHRRPLLFAAAVVTVVLSLAAVKLRIDPTLDRLRSVTPAAQLEEQIAPIFGLPRDVYVLLGDGPTLDPLLQDDERAAERIERELPTIQLQPASRLLPSTETQRSTAGRIAAASLSPSAVRARLAEAATSAGFRAGAFDPFAERLPRLLDTTARLTFEGYVQNGLGDLIQRFVIRDGNRWLTATYVFPTSAAQVDALTRIARSEAPSMVLTGLPMVNRELSAMFLPEFLKGLTIGSLIVLLLVVATFRQWRLSVYALLPTVIGLLWAAGILALFRVELDLFAVFAVVTFIGVGVDYGIHLVHRFQERSDAIQATTELVPVILAAAAITFLGYGTLFTSSYPPLRSIGIVSGVSVITLALASVFVLPALLMSKRK